MLGLAARKGLFFNLTILGDYLECLLDGAVRAAEHLSLDNRAACLPIQRRLRLMSNTPRREKTRVLLWSMEYVPSRDAKGRPHCCCAILASVDLC